MQQIYRRTPIPKWDFNKVAIQFHWNRTSSWLFNCKFAAYFQKPFLKKTSARLQPSSGWTFLGLFTDGEGWGVKRSHLPKICHIYLAITKLDTVTPYLKKIQKLYESRDTWVLLAPAFFHRKSANFAISKNTDILAFWYLISTSFTFLSLQRLFK